MVPVIDAPNRVAAGTHVVLVNALDEPLGTAEKLDAHLRPRLHRAFSVFVFNAAGQLLLQRRALAKYHSGGLWTNTCCGHPQLGEDVATAARQRLHEEMGFTCPLVKGPRLVYRASVGDTLTEYELDHIFIGSFDGVPDPTPAEVAQWRWAHVAEIMSALRCRPQAFTAWFPEALGLVAPM